MASKAIIRQPQAAPMLRVGDPVLWRGAWGSLPPQYAVVQSIEICAPGMRDGIPASEVTWELATAARHDRHITVSLDSGNWAYGSQLRPASEVTHGE